MPSLTYPYHDWYSTPSLMILPPEMISLLPIYPIFETSSYKLKDTEYVRSPILSRHPSVISQPRVFIVPTLS